MDVKLPYWASQIIVDKRCDRFVVTGGLGCLRGDVEIQTFNGLKPISKITSKDLVLSADIENNEVKFVPCSSSFIKGYGDLFAVKTDKGQFVANRHHSVFTPYGYKKILEINKGDSFVGFPDYCVVKSINQIKDNSPYYDLIVPDTNNYITKDGTIHHNSGKSTTGLLSFISYILLNPKAKFWWVCAPTHARIEDSMIPAAVFALDCLGRKAGLHYTLRKSKPQTITIHQTGQEIRFISVDRPEHMVSATLGGYFITEAFRIKREVYENIESRTRSNQLERTLGILEGTPEGDTWGKDEFNIQGIDTERKLRRFILHTHDNAHNLNPDYIPRLFQIYAHSPAMIKSYIYGEFSSFRLGDVFAQFVESRNVIDDIKPDPMRKIALCFDFNATPLTWSAWQTVPYKIGHIIRHRDICIAESSLDCRNLFDASLEVGKTFDPDIYKNTPFELWGDRTGHASSHKSSGTDFSNLRDYLSEIYNNVEIKAPREVTPIRASVDVFNRLLLYEMILICQSCKNMRRSLNMTKWAIGKDDLEKKQGETHTHHSDGARYRIWKLYKSADIDNILENSTTIAGVNPA